MISSLLLGSLTSLVSIGNAAPFVAPIEVLSIGTDAGTTYSDSASFDFLQAGILRLVGQNPGGDVAGRCNIQVDGGPAQTLPLSAGTNIYHTTPADSVGLLSNELAFPTQPSWGTATVTVSYDAGYSQTSGTNVACTAWFTPYGQVRLSTTSLLTLSAGATDTRSGTCTSCSSSAVVDFPHNGWLVLENQSDSSAYGGGAIILAIDGAEFVEYGVGDPGSSRPSRLAIPVQAGEDVTVELIHDDDTDGDNRGTRAVELTWISGL